MHKIIAVLTVGVALCFGNGQVGEASVAVDASELKPACMIDASSSTNVPLAFNYELPKPKHKKNVNRRDRSEISNEKDKYRKNLKRYSNIKKEKSAKKTKDERRKKDKNDSLTKNASYEEGAQLSQKNISKRKAAVKQSGISGQEQKENEIILEYQTQKVAVELAERKLANAQGRASKEVIKLRNQLAAEKRKLKPMEDRFDSLKITLHERNVSPQRYNIVKIAKSFVGTPYRYGGVGGRLETDCGQFIKDVLSEWGQKLRYRTACGQYYEYQEQKRIFTDKSKLKPGDLVFYHTSDTRHASDDPAVIAGGTYVYKGVTHVGIYQGNGCVIHASTSRGRVIENAMFEFAEIVGFGKTV